MDFSFSHLGYKGHVIALVERTVDPAILGAPSRDERAHLDWVAHSFLAVSPPRGNRRVVTPLLGSIWGFHMTDDGRVTLQDVAPLTAADWKSHLPYLRGCYPEWQFQEMSST
jgi:hypothetical protein